MSSLLQGLEVPVVVAPMAGGASTPELVAAVSRAGGFGFLPGGGLDAAALAALIGAFRGLSDGPFGVNLLLVGPRRDAGVAAYRDRLVMAGWQPGEPRYSDDAVPAKLALLLDEPVPLVSFSFGCPDAQTVRALHGVGSEVAVTVTGPAEAEQAAAAGADVLIVQGMEAGAHRGGFVDDPGHPTGGEVLGLLVALRLVVVVTELPLVAAGGIADGAGVAAVLAAGAVAAQLGTAFLLCPEAGTRPAHRAALARSDGPPTEFTRAFTGRTARAIGNAFLSEHGAAAPAAYPQVHHLTAPIRATGEPDRLHLWAGQAYPLSRSLPAADLVAALHREAGDTVRRLAAQFGAGVTRR